MHLYFILYTNFCTVDTKTIIFYIFLQIRHDLIAPCVQVSLLSTRFIPRLLQLPQPIVPAGIRQHLHLRDFTEASTNIGNDSLLVTAIQ